MLLLAHSPFLFGYAKPVPVKFGALRHPRLGMACVAAAGPVMNIALAFIAAIGFRFDPLCTTNSCAICGFEFEECCNCECCTCRLYLFPIPPLDGGRIAVAVLPYFRSPACSPRAYRNDNPNRFAFLISASGIGSWIQPELRVSSYSGRYAGDHRGDIALEWQRIAGLHPVWLPVSVEPQLIPPVKFEAVVDHIAVRIFTLAYTSSHAALSGALGLTIK